MVKLKVIVPIEEPTEWSNSFVAVEKPDHSLRICLGPIELSKAINTPDYKFKYIKGIIINTSQQPRSYIIKTDKGTVVRRNHKHIQFNV